MTDRERRLVRALTRLAIAHDLVTQASSDVIACMNHRAETIERLTRRVRWMAGQVRRELEKAEAKERAK